MFNGLHNSHIELSRAYNPWDKFLQRDEKKHVAEDRSRLCTTTAKTSEVIKQFLTHGRHRLDDAVPRQQQLLKDFLSAMAPAGEAALPTVFEDVTRAASTEFVLIDDRNRHQECAKNIGRPCTDCHIFSENQSIPDFFRRLRDQVRLTEYSRELAEGLTFFAQQRTQVVDNRIDKKILYIPNITSAGAVALAATCAQRSAIPMRDFLRRYLGRDYVFSASSSWGFFLEFHIPYHAMRFGSLANTQDQRRVSGKRLRNSEPLPLRSESTDQEELYYHEAQTSSLSWGPDEYFWTELFLVDTYFGSEMNHENYLTPPHNGSRGDGLDPPLGGRGTMRRPIYDPREYFLLKIDRRVEQVATEYGALVETFNKRMEEYARKLRQVFEDDRHRTNTQTLSNVIETIHIFVDCLSGIIDAWDTFTRTEIFLFTRHAPDRLAWPAILTRINRNMAELDRLRKLLITKRERFRFKLESLHTVSSLSQTETANLQASTAVSQGNDLKILTQMTVYVAFPLLFCTAFFSMEFANPPYPWAVFVSVLIIVTLVNYMVASQSSPRRVWRDVRSAVRRML